MTRTRSLLSDGVWLASLQVLASLANLAGVRILTGILPPTLFGELSLWLGVVTLAASALAGPTMQALLRHYPEYALRGQGGLVRAVARRQLVRLVGWMLPVLVAIAAASLWFEWAGLATIVVMIALVTIEMTRMSSTTLLNATRSHRAYGIWFVLEACARPAIAWALLSFVRVSTLAVLGGYLVASLGAWLLMRRFVPHDRAVEAADAEEEAKLGLRFWAYVLPLLPLGLVGWVSGMADRYLIGGLLTPADVGLYVAIYGLASRPMLMLGGLLESTFRPAFQSALFEGDGSLARDRLRKWVFLVVLGSLAAFLVAVAAHPLVAGLLLGKEYRGVSNLFPWIVGGHALLLLAQVSARVCYALDSTRSVLLIESVGALLAVVVGFLLIRTAGLPGAAWAVVVYNGGQLLLASWLARRVALQSGGPLAAPAGGG